MDASVKWIFGNTLCFKGATKLYPKIIFVSPTKIDGNTTKTLNCYFFKKFTFQRIRLNIHIWKTKFSSRKHYLFGLLFPRNAKKIHTDQSILLTFLLCLKRNVWQTLKSSSCKKVFPKCVYHGYNLLRCFLFLVITGRHSFL